MFIVKCWACGEQYFTADEERAKAQKICGACRNGYEVPLAYVSDKLLGEFASNE